MANVKAFRSERVVITVQRGIVRHKACQLFFGPDQSLYVSFPYWKHRTGILAAATIPAGQNSAQVNLAVGGKVTSHLVKYSHHPDGRAHFSQTGKVRSDIKRQSVPLVAQKGHIFTMLVQGIDAFDLANKPQDRGVSLRRASLTFQLEEPGPIESIKLVGRLYDHRSLRFSGQVPTEIEPTISTEELNGARTRGFLIASPFDNATHVLLVTCAEFHRLGPEPEVLIFYGGFSPPQIMTDETREAGFLAFIYPAADAESLRTRIGTVDVAADSG
jgi:hypothetical protein